MSRCGVCCFVDVRCWWCFGWSVLLVFPTVRLVEEVGVAVSASRLWIAVLNVVAVLVGGVLVVLSKK